MRAMAIEDAAHAQHEGGVYLKRKIAAFHQDEEGHWVAELSADIIDRGIVLTGGGAMIRKLDALLAAKTGIPVSLAPDPLLSVAYGADKILEDPR